MQPVKSNDGFFCFCLPKKEKPNVEDLSATEKVNRAVEILTPRNGVSAPIRFNKELRIVEVGDLKGSTILWKPMPPRPEEIDKK